MKSKSYCKTISIIMSIVMLLLSLPVSVFASGTENNVLDSSAVTPIASEAEQETSDAGLVFSEVLGVGEKSRAELSAMTVDLATLPEFIDPAVALEKGHVNRLTAQEKNSNNVIYQNQDGTKSAYIFGAPVKYIDADGTIKDKSSKISAVAHTVYSYAMLDNSVKAYFPKSSTGNTLLTYGDYSVSMSPVSDVNVAPTYDSESGAIIYPYVFGNNTLLVYNTQLSGIKEDIVIAKNGGANELEFVMTLTGLTPVDTGGVWYLKNAQNEIVGSLGKIIITDSASNTVTGTMTITAANVSGKYNVKITVPESFLNSEDTVYPVFVDPTVTIIEDGFYTYLDEIGDPVYVDYTAIEDYGIYEDYTHVEDYLYSSYHGLGGTTLYDDVMREGRVIYRFYDFYGQYGQYKNLNEYQIGKADFHVKVESVSFPYGLYQDTVTVSAKPMLSAVETQDSTIYNETLWSSYSSQNSVSETVSTSVSEIVLDITDMVKGWSRYSNGVSTIDYENPYNGFMFMIDNNYVRYNLYSQEATYTNNVYMVMDISDIGGGHYIRNIASEVFLTREESPYLTATEGMSDDTKWYIEYIGNNNYYIRTGYGSDRVLYVSNLGIRIGELPENPTDGYKWKIFFSSAGGMVIESVYNQQWLTYEASEGIYLYPTTTAHINNNWGLVELGNYVPVTSISAELDWVDVNQSLYVNFTVSPANATWKYAECFNWYSQDPIIAEVDYEGRVTGRYAGRTKIIVEHKYLENVKCEFYITVGQIIPNGTYYIINGDSNLFMSARTLVTEGQSEIMVSNTSNIGSQKWIITFDTNGYYYIQYAESGKYLSLSENTSGTAILLCLETIKEDATRWEFIGTALSGYKIIAENAQGGSCLRPPLSSPSIVDGANCSCFDDNSATDYNKWYFAEVGNINDVEFEFQPSNSSWCWLASARMFAKNYGEVIASQEEAILAVTGDQQLATGGNSEKAIKAIRYFLGEDLDTETNELDLSFSAYEYAFSENQVKLYIDNGHVIYVGRDGYYDKDNDEDMDDYYGHAVLIVGYFYLNNQMWLVVKDPGTESYGEYIFRSYSGLHTENNYSDKESEYIIAENSTIKWEDTIVIDTTIG